MGLSNPGATYLHCAEVFEALGERENCQAVLDLAHRLFMEMADQIDVPEWRQSFLENIPENRALMEMWERYRRQSDSR